MTNIQEEDDDSIEIIEKKLRPDTLLREDLSYLPMIIRPTYCEDITFLNLHFRNKENKYKPSLYKDLINKDIKTCSICLMGFTNHSKVLSLLCTHYFHSKCIIPWIKKHKQCPCCRVGT